MRNLPALIIMIYKAPQHNKSTTGGKKSKLCLLKAQID
ncbi:hypothetical protein EATG_00801 [Escherichia coli H605]|uniref:Uncharacterized protein n=1 Tax=Escherichia coli H605 TaxID=656410 RepID=A0AAJ3P1A6_ECOLX|nr:hypothetical protein AC26_1590 [Escherichia coli 1-176-05_S3_C2]OSL49928.1 hypothetical protein EATG_00801 [Escherichia coli H605]